MNKKFYIFIVLFNIIILSIYSQNVIRIDGEIPYPWVGGLNACQFGSIDLDGDGKNDIVAFDRHDKTLRCFLNKGGYQEIKYEYAPSYERLFPELNDWVVFADYDGDGLTDLFTYSKGWAGIKVYRNTSTQGALSFELTVFPYLTSWQGGGEVNILATEADYPALVDVDGDGDLDILTFGVMGTFIEKHTNLSMERFGHRDSLVFERQDLCWGRVAESEEDNTMYLDTRLFGRNLFIEDGLRHRGATVTARDLTGDGYLDLLLADVDYPGLCFLHNGGLSNPDVMVAQQPSFPSSHPVELYSMPVPSFLDVDNDGLVDMIVSPFDPNPMKCQGLESCWLYLNKGSFNCPDYHLHTKSFLQDQMLDFGTGSYPLVMDVDGDGLSDVLVGTVGDIDSVSYSNGSLKPFRSSKIHHLKNIGTTHQPLLRYESQDYLNLGSYYVEGLVPTVGDINADGHPELIVGTSEGALMLFDDKGVCLDSDYLHYTLSSSSPCLYDVDKDGILDLIVGNATGRISFYQGYQDGFEWVTDEWGGVDVRDYSMSYFGYSVPSLFHYDEDVYLAVGSESGRVYVYRVEETAVFEEVTEQWVEEFPVLSASFGYRSAPAFCDLNADGRLELMVGTWAGGLRLFNADIPVQHSVSDYRNAALCFYPNPVGSHLWVDIDEEGPYEVTIFDVFGRRMLSLSSERQIDVTTLASGLYVFIFQSETRRCFGRFVKE